MAIDELMNDHNEDLYEFIVNHFGMTSRESANICESTSKAIRDYLFIHKEFLYTV